MQIQSNVTLIFFLIISNVLRGYANNIYLTDGFHGYTRQMLNMNIRECLYMCKIRFPCLRRFHLRQPPRLNLHICCHSLIACTYPCPSNHLPCNCKEESGSSTTVTTGSWRQSYHSLRAKVWTVNMLAACLDELHVLALRPIKGFFLE